MPVTVLPYGCPTPAGSDQPSNGGADGDGVASGSCTDATGSPSVQPAIASVATTTAASAARRRPARPTRGEADGRVPGRRVTAASLPLHRPDRSPRGGPYQRGQRSHTMHRVTEVTLTHVGG